MSISITCHFLYNCISTYQIITISRNWPNIPKGETIRQWPNTERKWKSDNQCRQTCVKQALMGKPKTGPGCLKLMMSLVNDSLKFTLSDTQIC